MANGCSEKLPHGADDFELNYTMSKCKIRRPKSMTHFLEDLASKRKCEREVALAKFVEAFTSYNELKFAAENFLTLQHQCENSIKQGLAKEKAKEKAKEICLAARTIGLLALIIGYGDNAHEIYEYSLPTLGQALESRLESIKVRILECLAIVTLVGAQNFEETERSMKIIWQFIHPESRSSVVACKHPAPDLAAAISAWSLLLTTIDSWHVHSKYWKQVIPYFLHLLEKEDDESVRRECFEALALIYEKGCLDKFTNQANGTTDNAIQEGICIQELKDELVKKVNRLCGAESGVSNSFDDKNTYKSCIDIRGQTLTFATWSKLKKQKFLSSFLGDGFVKHMLENELLHSIFAFKPKSNRPSGPELYIPEIEEVTMKIFFPGVRNGQKDTLQRMFKSPNSHLKKAKTQILKKQRKLAHGSKIGDFMPDDCF